MTTCRRCKRPLTDPVSVERGMGPVCAAKEAAKAGDGEPDNNPGVVVTVDGRLLPHIVMHSPTGYEWGYGGSGPADLALSILTNFFHGSQNAAVEHHQAFKWDFVAKWGDSWRITDGEIAEWMLGRGVRPVTIGLKRKVYAGRRVA